MALQTSGAISFANLQSEFGGSHPITMGEYASHRVSGSGNTISMNQFYGASASLDTQTVTIGNYYISFYGNAINYYGFYKSGTFTRGSCSDGTSNMFGGNAIYWLNHMSITNGQPVLNFAVTGNHSNSGFTTMSIAGYGSFARTSATHSYTSGSNFTRWSWNQTTNPFGTSGTKVVTWT